jgi:hypothetical protein
MVSKEVALEVAAFLDSEEVQALEVPGREDVRKIAERFLAVCYDDMGKKPSQFDGQDLHGALGHLLPARFKRKDPLANHVPDVLHAYFTHLEKAQVVTQLFEIKNALVSTTQEFLDTVRTGQNAHHHGHTKQETIVHQAPKLGRNDPCSCGSGKKYKKCHGKQA